MPKDSYYELRVVSPFVHLDEEIRIRKLFKKAGVAEKDLVTEMKRKRGLSVSLYMSSKAKALKIKKTFANEPITLTLLEPDDWRDKWMHDYRSQPLGKRFQLVPLWEESKTIKIPRGRERLVLDPGSVFGSGTHATTKMMIEMMESCKKAPASFLDVGCGTGILSVVAWRLWRCPITLLDIDPEAVMKSGENLRRNACPSFKASRLPIQDLDLKERYGCVAANLLSGSLIDNAKKLLQLIIPRGKLLVSGIADINYRHFRECFKGKDVYCVKHLQEGEWHAFLFSRR